MSNLLALAGAGRDVTIRSTSVTVTGISTRSIAALLRRFPQVAELFEGGELKIAKIADFGPDVLAAIIAAGTGSAGNAEAEAVADSLGLSDQLALVEAIGSETFAGDPGGFMKRLEALGAGIGLQIGEAETKAPARKRTKAR